MSRRPSVARLANLVPIVGLVLLFVTWGRELPGVAAVFVTVVHVAVVMTAVVFAEEIAHRVGEPLGTLVLAVAVTVIEVALIVTLMVTENDKASTLARDTVFAAVMIVCNGVVGLCLILASRRTHVVRFSEQGANALLGTIVTLATLSLVMPRFTSSTPGLTFSPAQLAFAAASSAVVYGIFVFMQTRRLRWMFVDGEFDIAGDTAVSDVAAGDLPASDGTAPPTMPHPAASRGLWAAVGLLLVSLVAVVGLAKTLSPSIESAIVWAGAPRSFVGVVIALLVLLPESIAAMRAANRQEMQTSLNLSLGSALASIGLTIPSIAIASIWLKGDIVLGLNEREIVLLVLTTFVSVHTFASGRATALQATHHLVVFVAFVFLSIVP